jgi:hypothetical protein
VIYTWRSDGTAILEVQWSFFDMLEVVPGVVAHLYRMALGAEEMKRLRQAHNEQIKILLQIVAEEEQSEVAELNAILGDIHGKPS